MYFLPLFFYFFFWGGVLILISTVPLQGPFGWAEAGEPTAVRETLCSLQNLQLDQTHTQHTGLKPFQYTPGLLTVTHPWEVAVGRESSTIVPVSRVGGAKRQSPGRAAGCTAPCRAACPGRHSCSRSASGHWASDTPRGESSVPRRRFGCTESGKGRFLIPICCKDRWKENEVPLSLTSPQTP